MSSKENTVGRVRSAARSADAVEVFERSTSLKVAAAGVGLSAFALLSSGVWAAIFAVWGTVLTVLGVAAFLIVYWRR